jgi:hypothetical protein
MKTGRLQAAAWRSAERNREANYIHSRNHAMKLPMIAKIVAFPFAVFLQGVCAISLRWNERARVIAVGADAGVDRGTSLCGEDFPDHANLPWICCVLTVGSAILVQRRLEAAMEGDRNLEAGQAGTIASSRRFLKRRQARRIFAASEPHWPPVQTAQP